MSVAAADNPLTGSPWENAAIVPSTGDGQDATIEAAGFAAAGAGSASHSTIGRTVELVQIIHGPLKTAQVGRMPGLEISLQKFLSQYRSGFGARTSNKPTPHKHASGLIRDG
jgi:hypothetical protein